LNGLLGVGDLGDAKDGKGPGSVIARRRQEIIGVICVAAAVFALLSIHTGATGFVGRYLRAALCWAFGLAADIPPIILLVFGMYFFLFGFGDIGAERLAGLLLLIASSLVILELRLEVKDLPYSLVVDKHLAAVGSGDGGGIIGALLLLALLKAFGLNGTYVVLVACVCISIPMMLNTVLSRIAVTLWRKLVSALRYLISLVTDFMIGVYYEVLDLLSLVPARLPLPRLGSLYRRGRSPAREDADRKTAVDRRSQNHAISEEKRTHTGKPIGDSSVPKQNRKDSEEAGAIDVHPAPGGSSTSEKRSKSSKGDEGQADVKQEEAAAIRDQGQSQLKLVDPELMYALPGIELLESDPSQRRSMTNRKSIRDRGKLLENTLTDFGISASVVNVYQGPVVTRFEVQPARGTKVSRITGLADDIALALAAADVRIEAPVPGKSVVGIEVPNKEAATVYLRDVVETDAFMQSGAQLPFALGMDIAGNAIVTDIAKLIHTLIAGATGSGKSVCINGLVVSLLLTLKPHQLNILMIDPKRVELSVYNGIPHLVTPVVTDAKKAANALGWVVGEMERRYQLFSDTGSRNILAYNKMVKRSAEEGTGELPYIVVIVDELADLMLVAASEVEDAICRLAQMARAAGIYMVIATQRPSVDVITGIIKANIPSRIAFAVSSQNDSRTILDAGGAERLIGKGDMLFYPNGAAKPIRVQGAFLSDQDVTRVVEFWKEQGSPNYVEGVQQKDNTHRGVEEIDDELFPDAVQLILDTGQASVSMLQRRFRIGYTRAARLIDMMELKGIVGSHQGSKPREILVDETDAGELLDQGEV